MFDELKKLGLNENAALVYISLLKIGETSVGAIINDLRLHRQSVYNALEELEENNMVKANIRNKVHNYSVTDPSILLESVQSKKLVAKRLERSIKTELKKSRHEHEISVYNNRASIRNFFMKALMECPVESCFYINAGTAYQFADILGKDFLINKYDKLRKKRKIRSRLLASESLRDEMKHFHKNLDSDLREIQFLPFKSSNPVTTVVWTNCIANQFFFEDPFMIEIRNEKLRESYYEHFQMLWKMSKP